jgi:hypothetical protein
MNNINKIAGSIPLAPPGGYTGIGGPLNAPGTNAPGLLVRVLSVIIGVMTAVAFIYFTFQFFIGSIEWITAGANKEKVSDAKRKLTNGLIGLVVVVSGIFLIDLVGEFILGVPILRVATLIDMIKL